MKVILQKLQQIDTVYKNLFALIAIIYLINFSILCYYSTGNPLMKVSEGWYWPQKFFLYSPIYCFFSSVIIGIISYWHLCNLLRDSIRVKENSVNPNQVERWMVYSSTLFSIGIVYFSIAFWIL